MDEPTSFVSARPRDVFGNVEFLTPKAPPVTPYTPIAIRPPSSRAGSRRTQSVDVASKHLNAPSPLGPTRRKRGEGEKERERIRADLDAAPSLTLDPRIAHDVLDLERRFVAASRGRSLVSRPPHRTHRPRGSLPSSAVRPHIPTRADSVDRQALSALPESDTTSLSGGDQKPPELVGPALPSSGVQSPTSPPAPTQPQASARPVSTSNPRLTRRIGASNTTLTRAAATHDQLTKRYAMLHASLGNTLPVIGSEDTSTRSVGPGSSNIDSHPGPSNREHPPLKARGINPLEVVRWRAGVLQHARHSAEIRRAEIERRNGEEWDQEVERRIRDAPPGDHTDTSHSAGSRRPAHQNVFPAPLSSSLPEANSLDWLPYLEPLFAEERARAEGYGEFGLGVGHGPSSDPNIPKRMSAWYILASYVEGYVAAKEEEERKALAMEAERIAARARGDVTDTDSDDAASESGSRFAAVGRAPRTKSHRSSFSSMIAESITGFRRGSVGRRPTSEPPSPSHSTTFPPPNRGKGRRARSQSSSRFSWKTHSRSQSGSRPPSRTHSRSQSRARSVSFGDIPIDDPRSKSTMSDVRAKATFNAGYTHTRGTGNGSISDDAAPRSGSRFAAAVGRPLQSNSRRNSTIANNVTGVRSGQGSVGLGTTSAPPSPSHLTSFSRPILSSTSPSASRLPHPGARALGPPNTATWLSSSNQGEAQPARPQFRKRLVSFQDLGHESTTSGDFNCARRRRRMGTEFSGAGASDGEGGRFRRRKKTWRERENEKGAVPLSDGGEVDEVMWRRSLRMEKTMMLLVEAQTEKSDQEEEGKEKEYERKNLEEARETPKDVNARLHSFAQLLEDLNTVHQEGADIFGDMFMAVPKEVVTILTPDLSEDEGMDRTPISASPITPTHPHNLIPLREFAKKLDDLEGNPTAMDNAGRATLGADLPLAAVAAVEELDRKLNALAKQIGDLRQFCDDAEQERHAAEQLFQNVVEIVVRMYPEPVHIEQLLSSLIIEDMPWLPSWLPLRVRHLLEMFPNQTLFLVGNGLRIYRYVNSVASPFAFLFAPSISAIFMFAPFVRAYWWVLLAAGLAGVAYLMMRPPEGMSVDMST